MYHPPLMMKSQLTQGFHLVVSSPVAVALRPLSNPVVSLYSDPAPSNTPFPPEDAGRTPGHHEHILIVRGDSSARG